MKKFLLFVIIVAAVAAAWVTNPDKNQHKEKLKEVMTAAVTDALEDEVKSKPEGILMAVVSVLGGDKLLDNAMNLALNKKMEYHDYALASTATVDGHIVSVGVFGKVFTSSSDKIKEHLASFLKDNGVGAGGEQ